MIHKITYVRTIPNSLSTDLWYLYNNHMGVSNSPVHIYTTDIRDTYKAKSALGWELNIKGGDLVCTFPPEEQDILAYVSLDVAVELQGWKLYYKSLGTPIVESDPILLENDTYKLRLENGHVTLPRYFKVIATPKDSVFARHALVQNTLHELNSKYNPFKGR